MFLVGWDIVIHPTHHKVVPHWDMFNALKITLIFLYLQRYNPA
jgi:hypothetical protein